MWRYTVSIICGSILVCSAIPAGAQNKVIFHGKVVMADGSPPPKAVGIMRVCSDVGGSGPGPLTDKIGNFSWNTETNFDQTRSCIIKATLDGYDSTEIDVSLVSPALGMNVELKPIILTVTGGNPYALGADDKDVPGKVKTEWKAAMKAAAANDTAGALAQLKTVTAASPKFALAWHNMGVIYDFDQKLPEARAAYTKAIEADPKALAPYVALTRLMIKEKDWEGANKTAAAMIPLDKGRIFAEMYLHQSVAYYNLKNLAAAEASAIEALNPKAKLPAVRAEYVLGRILEAKGDVAGAKEHMARYLTLAPSAQDSGQIKAHIDQIGQPGAPEPELEILTR